MPTMYPHGEHNYSDQDEWFYNSIKRYKELVMFETEYVVEQIEFSDARSICVLGRKTTGQSVLSELALPSKLVDKKKSIVAMNSDLKIKSGVFPAAPIAQIICIYGEGKVVAAEQSLPGVALYELNVADTDQILRSGTLKAPFTQPVLSLVDARTLLLTANSDEKPVLLDLTSGQTCAPLNQCSNTPDEDVLPAVVSPKVALLCRKKDSETILYDVRSGTKVGSINGINKCDVWTVTTNYHALRHPSPVLTTFAFLSASGLLRVYDLRKLDQEISNCQLELPDTQVKVADPRIHLSPTGDYLSVSGFDAAVGIYHLGPSNSATEVFRHDGHNHMEQCHDTELTTITDHVWYDDYTVISAGDNMSLNCWQPTSLKLLWHRLY
ncbi:integrator complex assembly factor WDR73-like [Rhodnius prolixus]|uniref:Uncharacterized protein n=1 Tax=Rhodnius prolixus TaxID=13249 RepID=T1I653_RHOPR